jgi:glycosyltransferase involved in cell wall biosynthesis
MSKHLERLAAPTFSIVIPAHNEEKYLPACLNAARQQKNAPPYQVIVVDNASTDYTAQIAQQYSAIVVSEPRKGVARARQTGFEACRSDIIASTDADTRLTPFWLERIAAQFRDDPYLGAVFGPVNWYDGRTIEKLALQYPVSWTLWLSSCVKHNLWWGSNFAVRRDVFWQAGGFPVDWPTGEDTELALRVSRVAKVRYDSGLVVYASSRRRQEGWDNLLRRVLTDIVERFVLQRAPSLPLIDFR